MKCYNKSIEAGEFDETAFSCMRVIKKLLADITDTTMLLCPFEL